MLKTIHLIFAVLLLAGTASAAKEVPLAQFTFNERFEAASTPKDHVNYVAEVFEDGRFVVTRTTVCLACMFVREPRDVFETQLNPLTIKNILEYSLNSLRDAKVETIENQKMCRMMAPVVPFDKGLKIRRADGKLQLVLGSTACYERFLTRPTEDWNFNLAKELKKMLRLLAFENSK